MLDSVRKSILTLYRKRDIEKTIFHFLCSHSKCALDNDVCNILINVIYIYMVVSRTILGWARTCKVNVKNLIKFLTEHNHIISLCIMFAYLHKLLNFYDMLCCRLYLMHTFISLTYFVTSVLSVARKQIYLTSWGNIITEKILVS